MVAANANGNKTCSGIEGQLLRAAGKLGESLEPSDFKHVVLGLIFLRHVSHGFDIRQKELLAEDPDEYRAKNLFWVPREARWTHLQASAKLPTIGKLIDEAMIAVENSNPSLKGVLAKDGNQALLDKVMLGELIDLISSISLQNEGGEVRGVLGNACDYFLDGFAESEGRRRGAFCTPQTVARVLVEMLEPFPAPERDIDGLVYDPCCGSGGMFVQAQRFLKSHGGRIGQFDVYGQESDCATWRLCKMNLAIRGIDASGIAWNNEGTLHKNEWRDRKFDFIFANPPFNDSDWGGDRIREDMRWKLGVPPPGNANFAWLQHILWHLSPNGMAGVVLANGSMTSRHLREGEIRKAMIEADIVDCIVTLPGQLFYPTQIPACLWLLAKNKSNSGFRDRRGEVLFVNAHKLGQMVDRNRRELTDRDIARIAGVYRAWRGREGEGDYADVPGFCKSAALDDTRKHGHVLNPSRYVGSAASEEGGELFEEKMKRLVLQLGGQQAEGARLDAKIADNLKRLGFWEQGA